MAYALVVNCPSCGTKNRIPARHLASAGRCGACKGALGPAAQPIEAGDSDFEEIVGEARVPVLVDFWAEWCGPCRMAAPEVAALAGELAGQALVLKVDTEAAPGLAQRYRVQSIPNFAVFSGGRLVAQRAGLVPRAQMRQWIEPWLG